MMKIQKFKVLLYLKKGSTDKRGKAPIMGRITLNRSNLFACQSKNSMAQFSCKLSCTPNLWNPRSGRLVGKSHEAVDVNAKIDKMLLNINSAYDNLLKRNVNFTAQSIKELMQGSVECQVTLMDMMDKLYADMEKRVGIDRVEGSLVHYKQACTTLSKFIEAKFKTKDVAFGQLTNQFISDYYEFLITDCGFMSNSTRKYPKLDPATNRYSVNFSSEEDMRFLKMFDRSCMTSKSAFIKARIFGEPFHVVTFDKSQHEYYAKLSDFHAQFRMVGNNYNQTLKELKSHFSERRAMALVCKLEKYMMQLVQIMHKVTELSIEYRKKYAGK